MAIFGRTFAIEKITDEVLKENPWFRDLLRLWRPAGHAPPDTTPKTNPEHLRLAIRDGYLNFYRAGRAVAKVEYGAKIGLRASIHNKYVLGDEGQGQSYMTISSNFLSDKNGRCRNYNGIEDLRNWIKAINENHIPEEKRPGKEKQFVDLIVASNPNTIDLEMALPAYLPVPEERTAPRMDLVALEPVGDHWRIVFWEAKLVDDARARCRGDDVFPKVVEQLAQYTRWLRHADHRKLVAQAYRDTCRLLVEFRELAKCVNPEIEKLGPGIVAAAASGAPPLLLDDEPRLLIDNRTGDASFKGNGHLKKLLGAPHKTHVQMVSGLNDMALERKL
jgi:hypothetical protein